MTFLQVPALLLKFLYSSNVSLDYSIFGPWISLLGSWTTLLGPWTSFSGYWFLFRRWIPCLSLQLPNSLSIQIRLYIRSCEYLSTVHIYVNQIIYSCLILWLSRSDQIIYSCLIPVIIQIRLFTVVLSCDISRSDYLQLSDLVTIAIRSDYLQLPNPVSIQISLFTAVLSCDISRSDYLQLYYLVTYPDQIIYTLSYTEMYSDQLIYSCFILWHI